MIGLDWKKLSTACLTCSLKSEVLPFVRNTKGGSLSGQDPGSKVDVVKQIIYAQNFVHEWPLLYVVEHCRVKESHFCNWWVQDTFHEDSLALWMYPPIPIVKFNFNNSRWIIPWESRHTYHKMFLPCFAFGPGKGGWSLSSHCLL